MIEKNWYDIILYFDVENGNPNGDPANNGTPRIDTSNHGIVTDVCIKSKSRQYISGISQSKYGYEMLMTPTKELQTLNDKFNDAYQHIGEKPQKKPDAGVLNQLQRYLCERYYDVRAFGAVMSTGDANCGTIKGPIQIGMARSVSPVSINPLTITRGIKTNEERNLKNGDSELGRKDVVEYGLYRMEGSIIPSAAAKTGFSEDDRVLFLESLLNMIGGEDQSAMRGIMNVQKLIVLKHSGERRSCPRTQIFRNVTAKQKTAMSASYDDYEIIINRDRIPEDVEITELI